MSAKRLILLVVAIFAGGIAAFLAMTGQKPVEIVQQVAQIQEVKKQVLIINRTIGLGQRIGAQDLAWQDWPEGALRPEYITSERMPDALTQMAGVVVRIELFAGEPLREEKIVRSDQGYLSAVIGKGMRAVSIRISSESGAGGFIVPNDRVDVILTSSGSTGEQSATILENVRVLAIGLRLGEGVPSPDEQSNGQQSVPAGAQTFQGATTATVELLPKQAEDLINAERLGALSLALRSVVDFAETATTVEGNAQDANQIKVIRYGQQQSVTLLGNKVSAPSGENAGLAPVVEDASFQPIAVSLPPQIVSAPPMRNVGGPPVGAPGGGAPSNALAPSGAPGFTPPPPPTLQ